MNSDFEEDELMFRVGHLVVEEMLAPSPLSLHPELWRTKEETHRNRNYAEIVVPIYSREEFRMHFRMSRSCFAIIMEKVGNAKRILNLEKKLLFSVWMISKQESFLSAGDRFDFAKSVAHEAFTEILNVLGSFLREYVKWPFRHQYEEIAQCFREKSGGYIPGIIGAIDGCHIQIKQPVRNPIDYYNRKSTHSVILQAVCDNRMVFTDIFVGAPGRLHDARVFRNSSIYDQMDSLIPGDLHIVGDSAYPLLGNLITPFRDNGHLTERQSHYNTRLSSARVTIERAFGLLKGRFRRLKYADVADPVMANKIVAASVILHNHIILNKDWEGDDYIEELESEVSSAPPQSLSRQENRSAGSSKRNYLLSLF